MVEMFSREEMWLFGNVIFKCALFTLIIYFCIEAAGRYIKAKNEQNAKDIRRYRAERNEFEELGRAALNAQRMQSFIAEISEGDEVEITVEEILEELKERNNRNDHAK